MMNGCAIRRWVTLFISVTFKRYLVNVGLALISRISLTFGLLWRSIRLNQCYWPGRSSWSSWLSVSRQSTSLKAGSLSATRDSSRLARAALHAFGHGFTLANLLIIGDVLFRLPSGINVLGAAGFVLKDASIDDLIGRIRDINAGQAVHWAIMCAKAGDRPLSWNNSTFQ